MTQRTVLFGLLAVSLVLSACGNPAESGGDEDGVGAISVGQVAQLMPAEAKAAVQSYERDVRAGLSAYRAEFGRFPESFAEIPSAAALREAAVNVIADGLSGQIPFASRETLEQAASAFVSTAETRILQQMKAQDVPQQ